MKYVQWRFQKEEVKIIPIFDLHIGSKTSKIDLLMEVLRSDAFFILGGDLMEAGIKNSIGNVYEQLMSPQQQFETLLSLFIPHKDRILGICAGNHERRISKEVGIDVLAMFAKSIDKEEVYDPDSLVLNICLKKHCFSIFVIHGWTGARKAGGKMNAIQELRNVVFADIYLVGHSHLKGTVCEDILVPGKNQLIRKKQYFISAGSFVDYGEYAEQRGMPILQIGAPILILKKNGQIEINLNS